MNTSGWCDRATGSHATCTAPLSPPQQTGGGRSVMGPLPPLTVQARRGGLRPSWCEPGSARRPAGLLSHPCGLAGWPSNQLFRKVGPLGDTGPSCQEKIPKSSPWSRVLPPRHEGHLGPGGSLLRGCPVHYGMFTRLSGLYPLDASGGDNQKCPQGGGRGVKLLPVRKTLLTSYCGSETESSIFLQRAL